MNRRQKLEALGLLIPLAAAPVVAILSVAIDVGEFVPEIGGIGAVIGLFSWPAIIADRVIKNRSKWRGSRYGVFFGTAFAIGLFFVFGALVENEGTELMRYFLVWYTGAIVAAFTYLWFLDKWIDSSRKPS